MVCHPEPQFAERGSEARGIEARGRAGAPCASRLGFGCVLSVLRARLLCPRRRLRLRLQPPLLLLRLRRRLPLLLLLQRATGQREPTDQQSTRAAANNYVTVGTSPCSEVSPASSRSRGCVLRSTLVCHAHSHNIPQRRRQPQAAQHKRDRHINPLQAPSACAPRRAAAPGRTPPRRSCAW